MQNSKSFRHVNLVLGCVLLMLVGCAGKQPTPSGFIDDYSNLQEVNSLKGIYVHQSENRSLKGYTKFMIEPVEIVFHADAKGEDLPEEELQKLVTYYEEAIRERFNDRYQVVESPGPNTAILRTAITDIKPNKVYLNLHWSTTLLGSGIGGADFEGEFVDSQSGENILSVLDSKKGSSAKYHKGLSKWGHTKSVIKAWTKVLAKQVEEANE